VVATIANAIYDAARLRLCNFPVAHDKLFTLFPTFTYAAFSSGRELFRTAPSTESVGTLKFLG
jgi:hypothetical protein